MRDEAAGHIAVAIKKIDIGNIATVSQGGVQKDVINEILAMERIPLHENIVTYYGYHHDESTNNWFIVMELVIDDVNVELPEGGRTLKEYIAGFALKRTAVPVEIAFMILHQLLSAVQHMHMHGVAHRDLHFGNVMVKTTNEDLPLIKVIDFGTSIVDASADGKFLDMRGVDARWRPPELKPQNNANPGHMPCFELEKAIDVWSVGIWYFFLLSGKFRFDNFGQRRHDDEVLQNLDPPGKSKDILNGLLHDKPDERLKHFVELSSQSLQQLSSNPSTLPNNTSQIGLLRNQNIIYTAATQCA